MAINWDVKKRGWPTRWFYAWEFDSSRHDDRSGWQVETRNNETKTPTRKLDAWATPIQLPLGVRIAHPALDDLIRSPHLTGPSLGRRAMFDGERIRKLQQADGTLDVGLRA